MRARNGWIAATLLGLSVSSVYWGFTQQPAAEGGQQSLGGFERAGAAPADPATVAKGKSLYEIACQGCHGRDLRGGDMGGPNLLRSQVALTDKDGELIVPIIQGSRQARGMPAIPISVEDSKTVAAYVRSVIATIGRAGAPPSEQKPLNIVVGDAGAGQAYFNAKCKSCHSPDTDLRGIASRVGTPKALQNLWVTGSAHDGKKEEPIVTAAIKLPTGETVEGRVVHIDDFLISVKLTDGTLRTFERHGDIPKVTLNDPLKAHEDLLMTYTDADVHNVTAYLVTLK